MKRWTLAVAATLACLGCTTMSLERNTLIQSGTASDLRYREVIENLAMIAHNPAILPSYSSIFTGTTKISDTEQLASTTVWQHVLASTSVGNQSGFGSEQAAPQLNRSIIENWALDPIMVPEKLEAMRCACKWVLYGREEACRDCRGLLLSPQQDPSPGRHFGVADRLAMLEEKSPCWLHVGRLKDVPPRACYKAHCHGTWVWVMPDGMEGLTQFTLVLQDIARVDSNSESLFASSPAIVFARGNQQVRVTALVDSKGNLLPDSHVYPVRLDNVGGDAHLRSLIAATSAR